MYSTGTGTSLWLGVEGLSSRRDVSGQGCFLELLGGQGPGAGVLCVLRPQSCEPCLNSKSFMENGTTYISQVKLPLTTTLAVQAHARQAPCEEAGQHGESRPETRDFHDA